MPHAEDPLPLFLTLGTHELMGLLRQEAVACVSVGLWQLHCCKCSLSHMDEPSRCNNTGWESIAQAYKHRSGSIRLLDNSERRRCNLHADAPEAAEGCPAEQAHSRTADTPTQVHPACAHNHTSNSLSPSLSHMKYIKYLPAGLPLRSEAPEHPESSFKVHHFLICHL